MKIKFEEYERPDIQVVAIDLEGSILTGSNEDVDNPETDMGGEGDWG